MTEQTVPVPVDLLKRIVERTTTDAASDFGVPQELVSQALGRDILALAALIPSPPKVGDVLTTEQIKELPDASVMRDEDGDVLVKVRGKVRRATMDLWCADSTDWDLNELGILVLDYAPITLVSLPRD